MATAMITWGSDYPHAESTFPRSRDIVDRLLEGVSEPERRVITFDNTARIYGFGQPPESG
jgi:predicted TIM-barrel fold metal-dependent hydrolase